MAQIFHPSTNTLARVSIFGAIFFAGGTLWITDQINRSPYVTQADVPREQPVPFSHAHHVGGVGLDCRYCHTSVEVSPFAGIPPVRTCINCHSQLFNDSPELEPVREAFRTGSPLRWTRVNDLPDFVYFNHSIHVAKGVGCVTCHGRVDRMPLTWQEAPLQMDWCLGCHRQPERYVRPKDQVYNMDWAPANQLEIGRKLVRDYGIKSPTDCSVCHR